MSQGSHSSAARWGEGLGHSVSASASAALMGKSRVLATWGAEPHVQEWVQASEGQDGWACGKRGCAGRLVRQGLVGMCT